jgi:hypothetical protein
MFLSLSYSACHSAFLCMCACHCSSNLALMNRRSELTPTHTTGHSITHSKGQTASMSVYLVARCRSDPTHHNGLIQVSAPFRTSSARSRHRFLNQLRNSSGFQSSSQITSEVVIALFVSLFHIQISTIISPGLQPSTPLGPDQVNVYLFIYLSRPDVSVLPEIQRNKTNSMFPPLQQQE